MAKGIETGSSRRGPRPAATAWREQILDAAREEFGQNGYQSTTVRNIGKAAGVDAKLVHYYFGTKEELFTATITETFRARGLPALLSQPTLVAEESPGVNYLRAAMTAVEDDTLGPVFVGLVRNLGTHEESRRIFLRIMTRELGAELLPQLPNDYPEVRLALVGSQLLGLVMTRYILSLPPVASLSIEEVSQALGPTLDRYLLGDLFAADSPPPH